MLRRLQQDTIAESLLTLRHWMHDKRRQEISEDLINQIKQLNKDQAIAAIRLLKEPKHFVSGRNG